MSENREEANDSSTFNKREKDHPCNYMPYFGPWENHGGRPLGAHF